MINYAASRESKEERNKLANSIISVMGNLQPHLRDVPDFQHKLWDQLFIMSDFKLDADSPFEKPSKEVLIVAYANDEAVAETFRLGEAVLYSTSRNELWHKGATSGDVLKVEEVRINCEQNSLLYLVTPKGQGACHTKDETGKSRSSCYYRTVENNTRLRYS